MHKQYALVAIVWFGCQGASNDTPSAPPAAPAPPAAGGPLFVEPEVDLQLISQRAISAFRDDTGVFRAGFRTHDVSVADGIVELTPFHVASDTRARGGKLALETAEVATSDGTSLRGPLVERLVDGHVELRRGEVVETVSNREDGVEQAWRFDHRPASSGDLVVTVTTVGQRYVTSTATGLHFASADGLGFRYSHAVWVEASGKRWPIQARLVDAQIVMTVPEEVLARTAFPAVLDPTITPEVAVDAPVSGGTGARATQPAIAFDGTNYLVVWSDSRIDDAGDIFGTRVSPAGAVLDTTGIAVATTLGAESRPAVAFVGGSYVVAWQDLAAGSAEANIAAARVSTTGAVTQLGAVAASSADETEPAIGSTGSAAVVAWTVGGTDIAAARFDGTSFSAIALPASSNGRIQPAVAGNTGTGEALLAWSEGATATADLRGSIVSAAGTAGAAFDISAAAGRQFDPSATFDGTNYMLAWTVNSAGINVFGSAVSLSGTVLNTHTEGTATVGGVAVSTATLNQDQTSISCLASGCIVTWRDSRNVTTTGFDLLAQLVNPDFTLAGGEISVANLIGAQQVPVVARDGAGYFAAWQDQRDPKAPAIFGAPISAAGVVGTSAVLVRGNNREFNPAVGRAGTTQFVAWADSRSVEGTDLEFVRFSSSKLDATARAVSTAPNSQVSPSISASGAAGAHIVWSDTRNGTDFDIFGSRINADGTVSNTAGIAIAVATGDQLVPSVASDAAGASALVVWQDRRNGKFDIFGALLDATGNVVQGDIVISDAAGDQTRPTVAFDPASSQWVVVWADGRDTTNTDVFATRVSTTGQVLDTAGVNVSNATRGQFSPAIGFTGGIFLVAWEDRRNDSEGDIIGTRLSAGSAISVLDPTGLAISSTTGAQSAPSIGDNQGSFVIAWRDGRNEATSQGDIFAIQIGTTGAIGEAEFAITTGPDDESSPALNNSTAGVRIAYQRGRPDLQTVRVVTRLITTSKTTGNLCSTDAQCGAGGACVDGYCCDSACGGNDKGDCQACRQALTDEPNGVCAPVRSGVICRYYADTFCDVAEKCDGADIACPDDLGRRQGIACTTTGGTAGTCPSNDVTGSPHVCQ